MIILYLEALDYNNTMEKAEERIKQVKVSGGDFVKLENACFFQIQHI